MAAILERPAPRRRRLSVLALAGLLAIGSVGGTLAQAVAQSPASGHAQVIAHGVVNLADAELNWRVVPVEVTTRDDRVPETDTAGFLIASAGTVLVTDTESDDQAALAAGEALLRRPEDELSARSLGDIEGTVYVLGLGEASLGRSSGSDFVSDAFDAPGLRDLDLVRDVLDEGDASRVAAGAVPTLVLVTDGEAEIETGEAEPRTLDAGEAFLVSGSFDVEATAPDTAFIAAVVGDELEIETSGRGAPTTRGTGAGGAGAGAGSGGGSGARPSPSPTTDPDSDGDGLTDKAETDTHGTDPMNPDTDDDALNDGAEVLTYESDPKNPDSDQDTLMDGAEVNTHGSSPINVDTDGDLLPDVNEVTQAMTDPADSDTDDDNYSDHDELGGGTDPLDPDGDDDGLLDGDELFIYGTYPNDPDSDREGLPDGDEVLIYGTSPTIKDTDGDGLTDGNEIVNSGTSPTDTDTDDDGLTDGYEILTSKTNPNNPDTDGDGVLDGDEVSI